MTPTNGAGSLLFKDTATKTTHSTPESRNGGVCGSCHARHAVHVRGLVFARPTATGVGSTWRPQTRLFAEHTQACQAPRDVPNRPGHEHATNGKPRRQSRRDLASALPWPYSVAARLVVNGASLATALAVRPWGSGASRALNSGLRPMASEAWLSGRVGGIHSTCAVSGCSYVGHTTHSLLVAPSMGQTTHGLARVLHISTPARPSGHCRGAEGHVRGVASQSRLVNGKQVVTWRSGEDGGSIWRGR